MPIQPFVDRPKVSVGVEPYIPASLTGAETSGIIGGESVTGASGDISSLIQGTSVKTTAQALKKLTPLISSNGFPKYSSEKIDHTMQRTTYGYVELFINSDNEKTIEPYHDISNLNDPVVFLKDSGITAYPQVMLSPNWQDPGMLNGIIEPLSVRGSLAGASIESPFVAHTSRGQVMSSPVMYYDYYKVTSNIYNSLSPFIDSQDISIDVPDFFLAGMGIGDFGENPVAPYNDSQPFVIKNSLKSQKSSTFNDFVGVGIISKKASTTFGYGIERAVMRGKTGIRNVTGIDSLAFGGLMR